MSNSFLLHSVQLSWIEFALRILLFPKTHNIHVFLVGLCLVVGGQICRTWAMVTCGESFNHYIQRDKKESHVLVTHGMYVPFGLIQFNSSFLYRKQNFAPLTHNVRSLSTYITDTQFCGIHHTSASSIGPLVLSCYCVIHYQQYCMDSRHGHFLARESFMKRVLYELCFPVTMRITVQEHILVFL